MLNDNYKAFAFSASKQVVSHNTHFAISLDHADAENSSSAFCGKLRCNAKGTEFAIYDDSNDPYGLKTGKPRSKPSTQGPPWSTVWPFAGWKGCRNAPADTW